ncbi:hypothetical protein GDO86_006787 [Hymenochirus boettgeri]|uniref:G-protein coupled receptors family 1 profile domain-containing protein n=1 Tax=Hymenochirus boettgeri TaxID=247094 RepID=A0A8T2JCF2_9PIPI|nr:hypothetical protein GDO86_006787 [Hymenochirus boettgeri]
MNKSLDVVFTLDGLTNNPKLQLFLFFLFLGIYSFTILGNGGLIFLIIKSPNLQTPMYLFLKHLSFIDMCYTSVIIPRTLSDLLSKEKTISLLACALQFYFYGSCFNTEILLLAAMAYDRYVAICRPLLYYTIMKKEVCYILICACHFIAPPVSKLSCSDTSMAELVISVIVGINTAICVLTITTSYTYIFFTILKIRSAQGRHKAFVTCSSHLISVGTLFGTLLYMYMHPNTSYLIEQDKVVSVFYTMVIPMVNPIIYSFRNQDVRTAFRKLN